MPLATTIIATMARMKGIIARWAGTNVMWSWISEANTDGALSAMKRRTTKLPRPTIAWLTSSTG